MRRNYRLIDHTADIGIRVLGDDTAELFQNAGTALFDVLTDLDAVKASRTVSITVSGLDWPDLMVNWLRELLYLWSGKQLLVKTVAVEKVWAYGISAALKTDAFDPARHRIKEEIKAVTYHQIEVKKKSTGWESKIIFDV